MLFPIILCALVVVLLVADQVFATTSARLHRLAAWGFVALALVAGVFVYAKPFVRATFHGESQVDGWNVFHYYLNAKYFKELGYQDLYACAVRADQEGERVLNEFMPTRDLRTYEEVPKTQLPPCPIERFTPARWQSFVADFATMERTFTRYPADYRQNPHWFWGIVLMDKGYNLPPPFIVLSQIFIRVLPLDMPGVNLLFYLDGIFLFLACCFFARTFGPKIGGLVAFISFLFFGTYGFLFGMLFQHAWFSAILCALACWKRGWLKVSAALWAFAIVTRLFPAFLLIGWLVLALKDRRKRVFFYWLAGFCALFLLLGLFCGKGFEGYVLFFEKMRLHAAYLHEEMTDVGWKHLTVLLGLPSFVAWIGWVLATLALIFVARRAHEWEALALGAIFVFFSVDLSPNYYLLFALTPLLFIKSSSSRAGALTLTGLLLIFSIQFWQSTVGPAFVVPDLLLHIAADTSILLWMGLFVGSIWREQKKS